jgi:hypothetical protein
VFQEGEFTIIEGTLAEVFIPLSEEDVVEIKAENSEGQAATIETKAGFVALINGRCKIRLVGLGKMGLILIVFIKRVSDTKPGTRKTQYTSSF